MIRIEKKVNKVRSLSKRTSNTSWGIDKQKFLLLTKYCSQTKRYPRRNILTNLLNAWLGWCTPCCYIINNIRLLSYTRAQCAVSMAEDSINMLHQQVDSKGDRIQTLTGQGRGQVKTNL